MPSTQLLIDWCFLITPAAWFPVMLGVRLSVVRTDPSGDDASLDPFSGPNASTEKTPIMARQGEIESE